MSLAFPGAPVDYPGVERFNIPLALSGSGASPRTWTFQLPGYGVWWVYLWAYYDNQNVSIDAEAHISWFRHDLTTEANRKNLGNTRHIGSGRAATDAAGGAANRWTDLTASHPSATGLVTVTGTLAAGSDVNGIFRGQGARLIDRSFYA